MQAKYSLIANHDITSVPIIKGSSSPKSAKKLAIHLELILSFIFPATTIKLKNIARKVYGKGTIPVPSGIHSSLLSFSSNPFSHVT